MAVAQAVDRIRAGWNGSPVSTGRVYAELWPLDHERGLVPFLSHFLLRRSQRADLGSQQTLQLPGRSRRRRHGLWRTGVGWRGARGEESRPDRGQHPMRRRPQLRPGRTVDGCASQASPALDHAQQSRLASGVHVRRLHGRRARTRHRPRFYWQHSADPFIDYAKMAAGYGMAGEGPISDPTLAGGCVQARRGFGETRRTVHDRRDHAAEIGARHEERNSP